MKTTLLALFLSSCAGLSGTAKTTATGSRLVSSATYSYYSGSAFSLNDSSVYTYSGGRGGDLDVGTHPDMHLALRNYSTGLENWYRSLWTYNAAGTDSVKVSQYWHTTDLAWRPQTRAHTSYDGAGRISSVLEEDWDVDAGAWKLRFRTTYGLNGAGLTEALTVEQWDEAGSTWELYEQSLFSYDARTKPTTETFQYRSGGAWVNSHRYLKQYDAAGNETSAIYQYWSSGSFKNSNADFYSYTAAGKTAAQTGANWNTAASTWDSTSREVYHYDGSNHRAELVYQSWSAATSSWKDSRQDVFTTNTYGQLTSRTIRYWNAGGFWELTTSSQQRRYYYEEHTLAVGEGLAATASGGTMQLSPVPAADVLNLGIVWDNPQGFSATIADMSGRAVAQWNSPAAAAHSEHIPIGHLPPGTYSIAIRGSKGAVQTSIFTVVR